MGRIIPYIMENKTCSKPPTKWESIREKPTPNLADLEKKASWGWTCCEQIFHKGPFIFKETKYIIQYISIIHQYSAVASIFSIKECLSIDQSVYPSIHLHYSHTWKIWENHKWHALQRVKIDMETIMVESAFGNDSYILSAPWKLSCWVHPIISKYPLVN